MQHQTHGQSLSRALSVALLLLPSCANDEGAESANGSVTASGTSSATASPTPSLGSSSSANVAPVSPLTPTASTPLTPSVPTAPSASSPLPASGGQPGVPGTTPLTSGSAGEGGTGGSTGESSATAGSSAEGDGGSTTSGGMASGGFAGSGFAGSGFGGSGATGNAGAGGDGAAGSANGGENTGGTPQQPIGPLTVYIAGDSTVSTYNDTASSTDQAGWGQMLGEYFSADVTIENRAIGGRTARRFIDEGYLAEINEDIAAGDYLLVQFGTNDGNQNASYELDGQTIPYYLDPQTDFKTYLRQYLEVANAHQATLVLVTPPPRNSAYCTGGNGTGAHAQAMRELGEEEGIAVSDLNAKTVAHLEAICPSPTPEDFFLVRGDGSVDGTHFQENGARIMAGFVADGVAEANLPLAQFLE